MNKSATVGWGLIGAAALGLLSKSRRERIASFVSRRMFHHMEHMMASLPDTSPPKLVMSVLPRVREQNEQILEMLREQNALLRELLQQRQQEH